MTPTAIKLLEAKLSRDVEREPSHVVPGYIVAQLMRAAVKRTVRGMEGQ